MIDLENGSLSESETLRKAVDCGILNGMMLKLLWEKQSLEENMARVW